MIPGPVLFTWVQGAHFYRDLHRQAVELLPPGDGRDWLDAGCGPGLVARLAAARGYRTVGMDSDARMIRAARRLAKHAGSSAAFEVRSVYDLAPRSADVVSACSLLAILNEKERALQALWSGVRPAGTLLVVEPSERMNPGHAKAVLEYPLPPKRLRGLMMWAAAREGRAVPASLYDAVPAKSVERTRLLHGLVDAWLLRKAEG